MATLKTPPPATQGYWKVEPHDDGSWWVVGPDPKDEDEMVLVAPFETKADARHVVHLHNRQVEPENKVEVLRVPYERLNEWIELTVYMSDAYDDDRFGYMQGLNTDLNESLRDVKRRYSA